MFTVNIDRKELTAFAGQTILDVARLNGIDIPTLCHDERLQSYGGCGLCAVEVEGFAKLLRACATEATPGMVISTASERVRESRKMTLELLLSDHSGDCRGPCIKACPAHTDVQGYLALIANGEYREAVALIKEKLPLPASIGRVCPHPCEEQCRRQLVDEPLAIACMKHFAADQDLQSGDPYRPEVAPPTGKRVAIVGAGPAGLTAAYFLAKEGHAAVVYEQMPQGGGMLRYGIPEYRLPKAVLDKEIALIADMGVQFVYNTRIGQEINLDYLRDNFDAVFLGIGAWESSGIGCEGENLPGVLGGIDFLRDVALGREAWIGDRVAVVGGGNTAIDAVRTAVRLGAKEVTIVYRRTRAEMPADDEEINEAEEEGVLFKYLAAPIEICAQNGRARTMRLQKMRLGAPDASGRRSPVPVEGETETIVVDTVIKAIGQQVKALGLDGVALSRRGTIEADAQTLATGVAGLFAGGDGVTGPRIAIDAIAQGKLAAQSMIRYLAGEEMVVKPEYQVEQVGLTAEDFADTERAIRVAMPQLEPAKRRSNFREVKQGLEEAAARAEGKRCLECGCRDYFECKLLMYANDYAVAPERIAGGKRMEKIRDRSHPFLERNSEKCILCGLCMRACEDLVGVSALGLVKRGFESSVQPEFGLPLVESECVSCGTCVSVCPTGALLERYPVVKNLPVDMKQSQSVCAGCGVGCAQVVGARGDLVLRVLPDKGEMLCAKGRFGFATLDRHRVTKPLVRQGGQLVEASWQEAFKAVAGAVQRAKSQGSKSGFGVFVAPSATVEEAAAVSWFGRRALGAEAVHTFAADAAGGLPQVFGRELPYSGFDELVATDLILMIGSCNESRVAAFKVRRAVGRGARLVLWSPEPTVVDDLAETVIEAGNSTVFLKEALAAVVKQVANSATAGRLRGFAQLQAKLAIVTVSEQAQKVADLYVKARKAIILVDGYAVAPEAVQLLADMALLAGKSGTPRNGLIVVTPGSNREGLRTLGITSADDQVRQALETGSLGGLFIFGEDPVGAGILTGDQLRGLALVVVSPFLTPTAQLADVVLPGSTPMETGGASIASDGQARRFAPVKQPLAGIDSLRVITDLAASMGVDLPGWSMIDSEGLAPDHEPQLVLPPDAALFQAVPETDPAMRTFKEELIQQQSVASSQ